MSYNDVSLTSGMRSNLASLQNTVSLLNRTQERLSSGKKVNSALDNPTAYFAAQGHTQRASDLAGRKDGMSEAIQAVKAANSGISAITSLIESAKGLGQAARTANTAGRSNLAAQYDTLMTQIDNIAKDSGYKGTNFLASNTLTVEFNEDGSNTLDIIGFDGSAGGLGADATNTNSWVTDADIKTDTDALNTAMTALRDQSSMLASNMSVVTVRQDFTVSMISTLTTGADNLTLADMNEEGANMLMLQTRQSLGTTALSLSAQAAQSVLKLF